MRAISAGEGFLYKAAADCPRWGEVVVGVDEIVAALWNVVCLNLRFGQGGLQDGALSWQAMAMCIDGCRGSTVCQQAY